MINKRYMYLAEEILKQNPNVCAYMAPSLDARQDMVVVEVPRLSKEAAIKAIKEWGQPKSKITHLVFCTTSGVDMPSTDYQLTKLLSLCPSIKHLMMYQQGCFAGGTILRLAKDLAENNCGARVLFFCSEITTVTLCGPTDTHLNSLVRHVLFGDGAAAIIIGVNLIKNVERPIFKIISVDQMLDPDNEGAIDGHLREVVLTFHLLKDVLGIVSKNIERCLDDAFKPLGISDWNLLFWIVHPGGLAILDQVEEKLKLKEKKMEATRKVLRDYGKGTTGEGLEWGVLFGFVLHSVTI